MKGRSRLASLGLIALLSTLDSELSMSFAQGSAFTYQGWLNDGGAPANGRYDLRFTLYSAASSGSAVAGPLGSDATAVNNGLFTLTLDFGSSAFTGAARWLEIAVRTNGGGAFFPLSPRQLLTPTPYAISAANLSGALPVNSVTGPAIADGAVGAAELANNAVTSAKILDGSITPADLTPNSFVRISGDIMTGPLSNSVAVTSRRFFNSANTVSGSDAIALGGYNNSASAHESVIAGGVGNAIQSGSIRSTISGGVANTIATNGDRCVIAGGDRNQMGANGLLTTIGGGFANIVQTNVQFSVIAGGAHNTNQANNYASSIGGGFMNSIEAHAERSTIAGGDQNRVKANKFWASIGGGLANVVSGTVGTVPGGYANEAFDNSLAAGRRAKARHDGSFVWADASVDADFATTTNYQFLIRAAGGVGIGGPPQDAALDVEGDIHINNHDLLLRGGNDRNHGLAWYGSGKPFAGVNVDGPVAYGWTAGALGTLGPQKIALYWDWRGRVGIGTNDPQAELEVNGTTRTRVLTITGGADVAEPFEMSDRDVPKGALVVIDEERPGRLKLSSAAYDQRVAGIVSGANGVSPGLTLQQQGVIEGGHHVALTGRVYALADATRGAIKPGDLLTTSDTPGHAMKASDRTRAAGAVIGKAMTGLNEDQGLVLVLVSLQ
jgi:hypothetical protein